MAATHAPAESRCLKRGLAVLAELNRRRVAGAAEIAAAIGVPRPTVHRLLLALAGDGYVRQLGATELFTPRERVTELSAGWDADRRALEIAARRVDALADTVDWPIDLAAFDARDPGRASTLVVRHSTHDRAAWSLHPRSPVGQHIPLCGTAPGRMFLAGLDSGARAPFLADADADERTAIEAAAQRGYALRDGGLLPRTMAIALPITTGAEHALFVSMAFIRSTTALSEAVARHLPALTEIAAATRQELAV